MRAVWCERWCTFDELTVQTVPAPVLRPGTVRIRVLAAGVSFATQLVVAGTYQRRPPLPFVPGTEVAGEVMEVAPGVAGVSPGMRVFAVLDWGGLAQEAVADAIHVMRLPDGVDLAAAVAMPISYPTAAAALLWRGRLEAGQRVLVHGAGGGVGLAAVEVANAVGAEVVARAGLAKHPALLARGAHLVLDSALPFRDAVRAAGGVDVVLDPLGGDVFAESLRCLRDGGTLVTVGYAAGSIPQLGANLLLLKNVAVAGLNWGTYVGWGPSDERALHAERVRALWAQLVAWWASGQLQPVVHARFGLDGFREAMAQVRDRQALGRVVVEPWREP